MTTGRERRRFPRVNVTIPAIITRDQNPGERYGGEIQEISEGGARLSSSMPVSEVRGEITIKIKLGQAVIDLHARVVEQDAIEYEVPDEIDQKAIIRWADPRKGGAMGIEFQNLDPKTRRVIRKLVAQLLAQQGESP